MASAINGKMDLKLQIYSKIIQFNSGIYNTTNYSNHDVDLSV